MGYESKFYVVEKSHLKEKDGSIWGQVIATFDMSKIGDVYNDIHRFPETKVYIFADDGNTRITKDRYGSPLIEIPIPDMINILKKLQEIYPEYRRIKPFKKLLKGFNPEEWYELAVLHYGY